MKLSQSSAHRPAAGVALLMVVILVGVSIAILAGAMMRTQTIAILNQHNNDYIAAQNAAEAAVEKVYAQMAYYFQSYNVSGVSKNLDMFQTNVPTAAENSFWSRFQFSDANGNVGKTYVAYATNYSGPLPSAYTDLKTVNAPVYRIISNVVNTNNGYNVIGSAQEDVLLALVPLSNFAIFYNGVLEFTQCAAMTVNGRVQANANIYVGTSASLAFYSGVSTTGTLTAPMLDGLGSGQFSSWNTTFAANPGYTTNVASVTVSLGTTNSHFLIDIPPSGETPTSTTGQQRLYNQAQMVLLVTNGVSGGTTNPTVSLIIQQSVNGAVPGNDPSPTVLYYTNATPGLLSSNLPFLSVTNSFYDAREYKTNLVTQIDVGRFDTWTATNASVQGKLPATSGIYPTILYVADRRLGNAKQMPVVRVSNSVQLPANNNMGFSIATQNPLYTYGNYNIQTSSSGPQSLTTNNPANKFPSALLSDSLTVLASTWTDANSFSAAYSSGATAYDAADTTINAAIVTGTMPSTGITDTTFSGGVHNLPRLLQDWSSKNLWLNTSILRLWDSTIATNQFRNPSGFNPTPVNPYYNPPTRHYAFDVNFLDPSKVPPGIPVALVPIRFGWCVPPPGVTTFTPTHN